MRGEDYLRDRSNYENTPVKFFYRDVPLAFKSKEEGKPCFEKQEFISIMKPGMKNTVDSVDRKVKELDKQMWGKQYDNWKENVKHIQEGTMIEVLPGIGEARIHLCKSLNIHTLEQLINIDEGGIKNLGMGARELVSDAKSYLQGSNAAKEGEKVIAALETENVALKKEVKELKERIDELINDDSERSGRDATSGATVNGSGKQRPVHKTVSGADNKGRKGTAGTA